MYTPCLGCGERFSKIYEGKATKYIPSVCSGPCLLEYLKLAMPTKGGVLTLVEGFDAEQFTESNDSMRSSYEVRFLEHWLIPHKVKYLYEPYKFRLPDGNGYVPDFLLPEYETFVEVKGLWHDNAFTKFSTLANYSGLNVILVTRPLLRLLTKK